MSKTSADKYFAEHLRQIDAARQESNTRRIVASIEAGNQANAKAQADEIARLRAVNAELRAALDAMLNGLRVPKSQADHCAEREEACALARAALAKAEAQS